LETERPPNATGESFDEEKSMAQDSLAQAKALLEELVRAAQSGAIVPVRLPGQLEAIAALLEQAGQEAEKAEADAKAAASAAVPMDQEVFLKDQAAFVSHAIHELRTPMTSIRGYTDMMRSMGELNDMQKQFVETIRTNARRMEGLLTDVSDTSKIKAGTLRTNIKMDMFKNIAMMVEKQAQPLSQEHGRKLTFDIAQGLPLLNVDGELLAKAIYKLVENALRYTNENGEVTVRGVADGSKLVVTVEDNGIGMTPEELSQLGTIYFRSESELVRSYKGSGLGIPVAYGIIKQLGGTIHAASTEGVGTTFTITLVGMN
jgi:signal transduction histidine kinase